MKINGKEIGADYLGFRVFSGAAARLAFDYDKGALRIVYEYDGLTLDERCNMACCPEALEYGGDGKGKALFKQGWRYDPATGTRSWEKPFIPCHVETVPYDDAEQKLYEKREAGRASAARMIEEERQSQSQHEEAERRRRQEQDDLRTIAANVGKPLPAGRAVIWDNVTGAHRTLYATEKKGDGLLLFLDKGEVYEFMKPGTYPLLLPALKPEEIQNVTPCGERLKGIFFIYTKSGGCFGGWLLRREYTQDERARHIPATGATPATGADLLPGWKLNKLTLKACPNGKCPGVFGYGNVSYSVPSGNAWGMVCRLIEAGAFDTHGLKMKSPSDLFKREHRAFFADRMGHNKSGWFIKTL